MISSGTLLETSALVAEKATATAAAKTYLRMAEHTMSDIDARKHLADLEGVNTIRNVLNQDLPVPAEIVIGEGARDNAPCFRRNERVGAGRANKSISPRVLLAIDPVENTEALARNSPGAVSIMGGVLVGPGEGGKLIGGPEAYCRKLCLGPRIANQIRKARPGDVFPEYPANLSKDLIEQDTNKIARTVAMIAECETSELCAELLFRTRNDQDIKALLELDVSVNLLLQGDILSGLKACSDPTARSIAMGIGSTPEGVISAIIAQAYGGYYEMTPWFEEGSPMNDEYREQYLEAGIDPARTYRAEELVSGSMFFTMAAITDAAMLNGVKEEEDGLRVEVLTHWTGLKEPRKSIITVPFE